jgi:hypothetical protein
MMRRVAWLLIWVGLALLLLSRDIRIEAECEARGGVRVDDWLGWHCSK